RNHRAANETKRFLHSCHGGIWGLRTMKTDKSQDPQLAIALRAEETIEVVERNWRAEVETAQAYRDLAAREQDEKRKGILIRMAEAEVRHAQRWARKHRDLRAEAPVLENTIRRRLNRWWNRIAGADIAIRRMEAAEERHE